MGGGVSRLGKTPSATSGFTDALHSQNKSLDTPEGRAEWIAATSTFGRLDEKELLSLAEVFQLRSIRGGEDVITQGGVGTSFHLIVAGDVEVVAFGPQGQLVPLCTQGPGYYFGEVALVRDTPRVATVRAKTPCRTLSLDRAAFTTWVSTVPGEGTRDGILRQSPAATVRSRLETIPFISQMARQAEAMSGKEFRLLGALDLLGSLFEVEEWPAGEVVFSEGDPADKFYIVSSGAVKFATNDDNGREVLLNVVQKDAFFGEIGLLHDTRRTAEASTLEPSTLLSLSQQRFRSFLLVVPELRDQIEGMIRQRTAANLRSIGIFNAVDPEKRDLLGELLEFRMYRAGAAVVSQGEVATGMDVLVQGAVEVTAGAGPDAVKLATLRPVSVIGELALLAKTVRTASVTALEDCVTLHLAAKRFHRFLAVAPELYPVLEEIAESRRARSLAFVPNAPIPTIAATAPSAGRHPVYERRLRALRYQVRRLRQQVRDLGGQPETIRAADINRRLDGYNAAPIHERRSSMRRSQSDDKAGGAPDAVDNRTSSTGGLGRVQAEGPIAGRVRRSVTHVGGGNAGGPRRGRLGRQASILPSARFEDADFYESDGEASDSQEFADTMGAPVKSAESFDGGGGGGQDDSGSEGFVIKRTSHFGRSTGHNVGPARAHVEEGKAAEDGDGSSGSGGASPIVRSDPVAPFEDDSDLDDDSKAT